MKLPSLAAIGLMLVVAGLVALMLLMPGLFTATGPAPLRVIFGWGAFLIAPALILGGLAVAFAPKMGWQVRWPAIFWGEMVVLALLTLAHLGVAQPLEMALNGRGGGLVGWAFSQFFLALPAPLAWATALIGLIVCAWFLGRALPGAWLAGPLGWIAAIRNRLAQGFPLGRLVPPSAEPEPFPDTWPPEPGRNFADRWRSALGRPTSLEASGRSALAKLGAFLAQLLRDLRPGGEEDPLIIRRNDGRSRRPPGGRPPLSLLSGGLRPPSLPAPPREPSPAALRRPRPRPSRPSPRRKPIAHRVPGRGRSPCHRWRSSDPTQPAVTAARMSASAPKC